MGTLLYFAALAWLPNPVHLCPLPFLDSLEMGDFHTFWLLLSSGCSPNSPLYWVLWLSRLSSQIAFIFTWFSPPLCQECPCLWPKPQISLLDNYTGILNLRYSKVSLTLTLFQLACYVPFTSKIYIECVIHFHLYQDHSSSNYFPLSSG